MFWNEVVARCSCKKAEDLWDPTVLSRSYIESRKSQRTPVTILRRTTAIHPGSFQWFFYVHKINHTEVTFGYGTSQRISFDSVCFEIPYKWKSYASWPFWQNRELLQKRNNYKQFFRALVFWQWRFFPKSLSAERTKGLNLFQFFKPFVKVDFIANAPFIGKGYPKGYRHTASVMEWNILDSSHSPSDFDSFIFSAEELPNCLSRENKNTAEESA